MVPKLDDRVLKYIRAMSEEPAVGSSFWAANRDFMHDCLELGEERAAARLCQIFFSCRRYPACRCWLAGLHI